MDSRPDQYALALRARQGDSEALAALIEASRPRLFRIAYAELRHHDDAQDAVAAALLRVCRHVGKVRNPEQVGSWMDRIARNEARRLGRRRAAESTGADREGLVAARPADAAAAASVSLLRLDIERALARLPGDQARALRRFYLSGEPVHDIAAHLGRSPGTVKSWLHRARRHLAVLMKEYRPMEPTPPSAHILHTDLDPVWIRQIANALQSAGYHATLPAPGEVAPLLDELKVGAFGLLEGLLEKNEILILDEQIGGRPALEILVSAGALLSQPIGLSGAPRICLLCADPWGSTAFAVWNQGVHLLVNKNDAQEMARLPQAIQRLRRSADQPGRAYSAKAKRACNAALAVAHRTGAPEVEPDHLALVLLTDRDTASYKALQQSGVDCEAVRREILNRLENRTVEPAPTRSFLDVARETPRSARFNRVHELAYAEAWQSRRRFLSTADQFLGVLRLREGVAGRALARLGVDAAALRTAAGPFQAEEDEESPAFYAAETEERAVAICDTLWDRVAAYTS